MPILCRWIVPAFSLLAAAGVPGRQAAAGEAAGPDYLPRLATWDDWFSVSVPVGSPGVDRAGKYLVPARDDAGLLGTLYQNVGRFPFHFEFLAAVFPERFPGLTLDEYLQLVERRATRSYHAGAVTLYYDPARGGVFGFTVFTDGREAAELLEPDEVKRVYDRLKATFLTDVPNIPLEYAPVRTAEIARARTWVNPGFPVYLAPSVSPPPVIGYTAAVNFGRLRRMTLAELAAAEDAAAIGWQDLLVLDDAPSDIKAVVAGVVTAQPQGDLSHLTIRLARRGVPNAYVSDARAKLAGWEGKLVRLEVTASDYTIREAGAAEAEAWWSEHRPKLRPIPAADESHSTLDLLAEMTLEDPAFPAVGRFGGKAANLARLYRHLAARHQTPGFGVPFRHYREFLRANRRPAWKEPARQSTYEEFLADMLADEDFRTDGAFRREALAEFRERTEDEGVVAAELLGSLRERISEVFGGDDVKVRFRSSSNAEDAIEFNGAGLYDSTSVCMADELDDDEEGPSRCDATKKNERTIARGLKQVWASLWAFEAYEEREYFQIEQARAAMAVLVTRAYPAEDSNGVAFTGNPSNRIDRGYTVTSQVGDESVVGQRPGVEAAKDVLVIDTTAVARVLRVRNSSLVLPGMHVLSTAQLTELGEVLAAVAGPFLAGIDLGGHPASDVLVDVEFKFQDGQLVIKQARPFLIADPAPLGPVVRVELDPGLVACGLWQEYREPADEYRLKSRLDLRPASVDVPIRAGAVVAGFVDGIELGPDRLRLEPVDGGIIRIGRASYIPGGGGTPYTLTFDQHFALGDRVLGVTTEFQVIVKDGVPLEPVMRVTEDHLYYEQTLTGAVADARGEVGDYIRFGSCTYSKLPLWEVEVGLGGADRVLFHQRYQPPVAGSGPANVLRGEAWLDGQHVVESSYWRVVYAADHHNWNEEFELVFDPPVTLYGLHGVKFFHVQEGFGGEIPPLAALLDAGRQVLKSWPRPVYSKRQAAGPLPGAFRRGEATGDGKVDISDAVRVLGWLFTGGGAPVCGDAADADDSGVVEITDAIRILQYLFLAGEAPASPGPDRCGLDDTLDALGECAGGSGC